MYREAIYYTKMAAGLYRRARARQLDHPIATFEEQVRNRESNFLNNVARRLSACGAGNRGADADRAPGQPEVDKSSIGRFVDWAIRKGYCPKEASVDQMVDTRFLEVGWKEVGRES